MNGSTQEYLQMPRPSYQPTAHPIVTPLLLKLGLTQVGTGVTSYTDEHGNTVHVCFAEVSPEPSAKILADYNDHNRFRSDSHVQQLAYWMATNQWMLNGTTLIFDSQGRLIDGSNRLAALMCAGVTLVWPVVLGVNPDAFLTLDQHMQRKLKHALQVSHATRDQLRQKVICHLYRYELGLNFERRHATPTNPVGLALLFKYEPHLSEAIDYVAKCGSNHAELDLLAFLFTLILPLHLEGARHFMHLLLEQSLTGVGKLHPVSALLTRLRSVIGEKSKRTRYNFLHEMLAVLFYGWNVYCRGAPVGKIQIPPDKNKNNPFPDGARRYDMPRLRKPCKDVKRTAFDWFYKEPQPLTSEGVVVNGYESTYTKIVGESASLAKKNLADRREKARDLDGKHNARLQAALAVELKEREAAQAKCKAMF